MENLTFGLKPGDDDGRQSRVVKICSNLGLRREILFLDGEDWMSRLSSGEAQLLSIARALIANPEMICIHQPTAILNDASTVRVMKALKQYVGQRGICQDPSAIGLRRPRTCIFTSARVEAAEHADVLIYVDNQGAREVARHHLENIGQTWTNNPASSDKYSCL